MEREKPKLIKDNGGSVFQRQIEKTISPWVNTNPASGLELPGIQVIEIARSTNKSSASVISWINRNSPTVVFNQIRYQIETDSKPLPESESKSVIIQKRNSKGLITSSNARMTKKIDYPLSITRTLNLNPKRIIRNSRYESRSRGAGPVKRARFQQQNVTGQIVNQAKDRTKIFFKNLSDAKIDKTNFPKSNNAPTSLSFETVALHVEKGGQIVNAYNELAKLGEKDKLVFGRNNKRLTKNLMAFAEGQETDFLIWNCIGFYWSKNWQSNLPACEVVENSNESIALYYLDRIKQLGKILSPLGSPSFTVLLPSNEVFDYGYSSLGLYNQPENVRAEILQRTASSITDGFKNLDGELSQQVRVLNWRDYLKEKNVLGREIDYSIEGKKRIREASQFSSIKTEMLTSARSRFKRKDILLTDYALASIQEYYYSMYAGEGVAFEEMDRSGKNIIVLNFEEMRVPRLEYLGAQENVTILTPIKSSEMKQFYDWKNNQIAIRYRQTIEGRAKND